MSSGVREFLRKSNVNIQTTPSPQISSASTTSSVNSLTRNIEMNMVRRQQFPNSINKEVVNNTNYGEFAQFVYNSENNNSPKSVPARSSDGLVISKLNPGMFNATVNKHFTSGSRINLKNILLKKPKDKTPIGSGLFIDTIDIKGIYGRFQTGFIRNKEYGAKGDLNKNYFSVQFNITVSDGNETKGASVNFYKNGKMRFSGGFVGTNIEQQADLIRRYMVNTYSDKEAFLFNPFEYNNLSGQFRINGVFRDFIGLAKRLFKYGVDSVSYESELSPFMYLQYKGHKYILSKAGNVQISGAAFPSNMVDAYNKGMDLVRILHEKGEIIITTSQIPMNDVVQKKKKVKTSTKMGNKKLTKNQVNALNVDNKKCMRMPKKELLHFARTLGVVGIKNTTKKEDICKQIKKITNSKSLTFKNTNKNKNVPLSGKNNKFKIGRSLCGNYSKTELLRVAKILGVSVNANDTKITLCKKIEKIRNNKIAERAAKATNPVPQKPKVSRRNIAQKKKNDKKKQTMQKRGMSESAIKSDIVKLYGKRWMNKYKNVMPSINNDVKNVKARINKLKTTNKSGVPFKKDVDIIKKRMVQRWKQERERTLERNFIMKQINTNGVKPNKREQYRRAAVNYIMTHGPTKKELDKFKKTWINLRSK